MTCVVQMASLNKYINVASNVSVVVYMMFCCRSYDVSFFFKAEYLPRIGQLTLGFIPGLHMKEIKKSYNVQEIIIHKTVCALYLLNDIAILKLTTMVEENSDVAPLCVTSLPPSDFYGTQCVVT